MIESAFSFSSQHQNQEFNEQPKITSTRKIGFVFLLFFQNKQRKILFIYLFIVLRTVSEELKKKIKQKYQWYLWSEFIRKKSLLMNEQYDSHL